MSLTAALILIVIADVALIGGLAWVMSHPRKLTPHVPASADPQAGVTSLAAAQQRKRRARLWRAATPHTGTGAGRHGASRRRETVESAS